MFFFSASSQIHFDCHRSSLAPLPHSSDEQINGPINFQLALDFYVEKNCGLLNIASWLRLATKPFKEGSITDVVHRTF